MCKPIIDGGNRMNCESHKTIDKLKVADGKHPCSYKVSVVNDTTIPIITQCNVISMNSLMFFLEDSAL